MFESFQFKKEEQNKKESKTFEIKPNPEKQKTEVPVLIAPGWNCTFESLKESSENLSEHGRHVLFVEHARKKIMQSVDENPTEELQKAFALLDALKEKEVKNTDAIGYSEGAINLTIAASIAPEKFRNLILASPAGFVDKGSFIKLTARFLKEITKNSSEAINNKKIRDKILKTYQELGKNILKNPLMSTMEVKAISESDIYPLLKNLKEKGIKIAIVSGASDSLFPPDKMQKNMSNNIIDGFYSIKGGHFEIFNHPENYMNIVDEALDNLEKTR